MWFSFSTSPGTKFVINGHLTLIFGYGKLYATLKMARKVKNIEKMPFQSQFIQKTRQNLFLTRKMSQWLI